MLSYEDKYELVTEALLASVIQASSPLEIQLNAYSSSDSKVLVDFRQGDSEGVEVRVYLLEDGLFTPYIVNSSHRGHYESILGRVQEVISKDQALKESLSQAFLRNRLIRALTHLKFNSKHINKANLEIQLNQLDGRDKILPRFIKAPSVHDVSFEITEFGKPIKSKIKDLSIGSFFSSESHRVDLSEVLVESKKDLIATIVYRDIGVPVDEDDPRLPLEIVEVEK